MGNVRESWEGLSLRSSVSEVHGAAVSYQWWSAFNSPLTWLTAFLWKWPVCVERLLRPDKLSEKCKHQKSSSEFYQSKLCVWGWGGVSLASCDPLYSKTFTVGCWTCYCACVWSGWVLAPCECLSTGYDYGGFTWWAHEAQYLPHYIFYLCTKTSWLWLHSKNRAQELHIVKTSVMSLHLTCCIGLNNGNRVYEWAFEVLLV